MDALAFAATRSDDSNTLRGGRVIPRSSSPPLGDCVASTVTVLIAAATVWLPPPAAAAS